MVKVLKILPLALIFLFSSLYANDTYDDKKVGEVKISIENADSDLTIDSKTILSKLKTQKNDLFSQSTFDSDLKTLSNDFDKIESRIEIKDDLIYVHIRLWIRPTIRKIEWVGNEKIKSKKLQSELDIKSNTIFNRAEFNKALNKVKELYVKKGFFESQITYKEIPLSKKNEVKIQITVKEGKLGKVQKIEFKGFTKKEQSDLLNQIITKKYNILLSWISGAGIFREDSLEQDKMSIINFLQNKGYADAKVDINILEDPKTKKIIIEIVAHRGILYRFGKVTFDGNHLISDEDITKRFLVYPDDPFSPEKIRETATAIKDSYGAKGYIETQVYYETHLMENEPIYNVDFYIDEGESCKIGLIKVFGNKSTKTSVILRQSLLIPGETFDTRKLKATQTRLESMGFFKNVNVYAVQSTDKELGPNYRDVHIEVEETSTGHLSFAAGFSSTENVTGTLDLTENNFDHLGIMRLFSEGPSALRGAGEYLQLKASAGKRQKNFSINWATPYFHDTPWKTGFEFSGTTSKLQAKDYRIKTLGGSVFASYPLSTFMSLGSRYRLRNSRNRVKNKILKSEPKDKAEQAIKDARKTEDGLISGIGLFLNYDSTDNSYKPHQGLRSSLDAEFVGLGGKYKFWKYSLSNAYYYPLWTKGTFKYRFDAKFIDVQGKLVDDKVPLSERFFLGGEKTVRGYKPFIIGPILPGGDKNEPQGGVSSLLLSIEYNQEIIRPLIDAFIFADAGSINFKEYRVDKIRASVGVGVRLEVMNRVPITVGWGYPINPKSKSDRQSVFFYMGGQF